MANWSNPTLTSLYTDFVTEVKNRDVDLALGLDPATTSPTNVPANAIRWNSANSRWEKYTSGSWGTLTATYALTSLSLTGSITFEGATDDAFETTLTVADPTADRTITLPNVSGTVVTTGDTGSITSTMIADGAVVNADISASAAIAHSKLANITAGQVLLGNASNIPTATALTGDVTIDSSGVTAIGSGVIVNADINASAAIAGTKISPDFGSQNVTTTGTSTAAGFIPSSATVPSNGLYLPAANQLGFSTASTSRLVVDASGNVNIDSGTFYVDAVNNRVGIGTTGPSSPLHVYSVGNTEILIGGTQTPILSFIGGAGTDPVIGYGVGDLRFGTTTGAGAAGFSEKMRLDASGHLLVGTTTDSGGALLQVNGDRIRVATAKTPASATATGTAGEVCWDASYIYVCTATNTWKRAAIATW